MLRVFRSHELQPLFYVGIDIGATQIKMGLVTRAGTLVEREQFETIRISSLAHFIDVIKETIERLLQARGINKLSVGGIGIGAPGWVDHHRGIVRELTNMPGWKDVPLAANLESATGLKSFVDNDANVTAIGELIHGEGKGRQDFVCMTLGTGVGGAIVIDGKIYRGADSLAGEIGHMTLDVNGPECACGAKGCLERYVGNRFIVASALRKLEMRADLGDQRILLNMAENQAKNITPKLLAEAAAQGDKVAIEVWRETGHYIGVALAAIVNVLNPECFIIGGGVAKAGPVLFDAIRATTASLAMNGLGATTPILPAHLRENSGIVGAAAFGLACAEKT
jgi:glucokinase